MRPTPRPPTHCRPTTRRCPSTPRPAPSPPCAWSWPPSGPPTPPRFQSRWPAKYLTTLPYDPLKAVGLDTIAASALGISAAERTLIARNGFAISARQTFPTFLHGFKGIYADHLPVYVSLDSVLHAVHRSYDSALMMIEQASLNPTLTTLLANVHAKLGAGMGAAFPAEVRADVDLYLTVARRLLGTTTAAPVAGADAAAVTALVDKAKAGTGIAPVSLFGETRYVDFTQFTPRGHYVSSGLPNYFRAQMWLGRTDLRFLKYDTSAGPSGAPTLDRRQFLSGLLLASLTAGTDLDQWRAIDETLRGFVGESDNMTVADFPKLFAALGATSATELIALPDQTLAQGLLAGGYGIQRIASQILFVPPDGAGAPLDRVFLFFGQRFVIDSEVLSNVVFDRVRGTPKRMMPNPLDVAFAALGNNAAAPLLNSEMQAYPGYLGALHDARRVVDLHGDDFWGGSLYSLWMSALRGASIPDGDPTAVAGLPAVMKTEAWSRRMLSTQLASWAELRHDTLLYAKQSYTAFPTCIFPDAYVDPYPEAWGELARLARLGQALATRLPSTAVSISGQVGLYFTRLESAAEMLRGMALAERAGTPFTAEQMAFINQTVDLVTMSAGSGPPIQPKGWYPKLFLTELDAAESDPTIADVHSNPAEGQILHVATGLPRLIVVTADTCNGPRAYAGVVSSYTSVVPSSYTRLTDETWSKQLTAVPARRSAPG